MMASPPKISSTLQVEFDGKRLTAHFEEVGGKWEFKQISSNVAHVDVLLVTHLVLLMQEFQK
jgi:hypothetical protein